MMTRLFLKNNKFLLILKGLLGFLLCSLIILQNIDLIQYTNSIFNLKGAVKKDRIEFRVISLLDFNHDSVDSETMNQYYQMLKKEEGLLLQYTHYSPSKHMLYMDVETYQALYDQSFNKEVPCVLVPENRLSEIKQIDKMKVVGSNSLVGVDSLRLTGYDPITDYVVLYRDLIVDSHGGNFAFNQGNEFILSAENEESAYKIENLLFEVKEAFKKDGYSINFLVNRIDQQLNYQNRNNKEFLQRESLQNISAVFILLSGILLLSQIMILSGKKLIAISLFLGKKKSEIFGGMFMGMILCDVFAVLFSLPLLNQHIYEYSFKTCLTVFAVLLLILAVLDALVLWILLYTMKSKKLLFEIQQREE